MANCTRCRTSVGCGCQLTNGLCSGCIQAIQAEETASQPNK